MNVKNIGFETFNWIDLENPKSKELMEIIQPYGLNPHLMEDLLQIGHLPKLEMVGKFNFMILRAFNAKSHEKLSTIPELSNKVGFFFTQEMVLTVHQKPFPFLEELTGKFESSEALILHVIEKMLATYQGPADWLSEEMDRFEGDVFLGRSNRFSVEELYFAKAKARACKKVLQLTQTVLLHLNVQSKNEGALQDLKETTAGLILQFEDFLEEANSLLNIYLSSTSQKTNEVMKLLTIFSAFFLPLTFLVGVYGMNFKFIPELSWQYGYFLIWGAMVAISLFIYFWFKRKKIL